MSKRPFLCDTHGLRGSDWIHSVYFAMMFLSFIVMRAYYRAMSAAFVSQGEFPTLAGWEMVLMGFQ